MGHKGTQRLHDDTREMQYWLSMQEHDQNQDELKIKVLNYNLEKDFQDAQNVETYKNAVAQQDFKHRQEWKKYERSQEIADEQISYNRKAAMHSKKTLDNQAYERYLKLQFEGAGALLKHRVAQQKTRQGERELLQGHSFATAKAAITAQENLVKSLKKVGTATVRGGRGRSLDKEVAQWWGVAGREQAAMLSMMNSANEQVATKLYGLAYTAGVHLQKRDLTVKAEEHTRKSIEKAHKFGTEEILLKWEGADMKANHQRLLEPEKGPAPIKPTALPRLEHGDVPWKDSFNDYDGILKESDVKQLQVYRPGPPGLHEDFREKHNLSKKQFSDDFDKTYWTRGPRYEHRKDHTIPAGVMQSGARASTVSVGSVSSAVGAGMMAASAIGAATTTWGGAIGLGGLGSIGLGMLGPIGMGIAAIGFIGSIFDWW